MTAKYIAYLWIFWNIKRPLSPSYLLPELNAFIFPLVTADTWDGKPLIGSTAQAGGFKENAL